MAGRLETEDSQAPLEQAGTPHERSITEALTPVERLPILLVDDRPENLRALEAVLTPLGFPLVTASSGTEALRVMLEQDFSLILLDVRMPGIDGIETARLIKGRDRNRDVPIVFLTAARDEVSDIILGYGVGAVDYVLKPFEPELLRSKVAVFAELESSRRALKRSEAFLRGAFAAAPIGKTVLDREYRIIRSNPAFARMLDRSVSEVEGVSVRELCNPEDRDTLGAALDAAAGSGELAIADSGIDLRLQASNGTEVWVAAVSSPIEPNELAESLVLVQWVDLSARRRAEEARAELLLEQSARAHAESVAARLEKLQALTDAFESITLDELLGALALRLSDLFAAEAAEVELDEAEEHALEGEQERRVVRASHGQLVDQAGPEVPEESWVSAPVRIEGKEVATIRVAPAGGEALSASDRSLLHEAAERAALSLRRAQLHEEEHRIAVELQRGLLPKQLPDIERVEVAAHYEAAGIGAQVGGDWYDAFELAAGKLGMIVGDVAGRGIPAASTMGQLRSVTRGFALGDGQGRGPGEVLTRLNRHQLALSSEELFTVLYAVVDPASAKLTWSNAGHPPPLLRRADRTCHYLEGGDGLMGIEDITYQERSVDIGPGDTLVLYSDGVIERRGESLDAGMQRLADAAASGPEQPAALIEHLLAHTLPPGHDLSDDVTAVSVRVS
ncbi:MAG: SpoIIE family protein phosphatase [Solirubrobacterales bacterium]|nr:SpoIIE family protein phosphatase [Solirubrobacterales bacterium]